MKIRNLDDLKAIREQLLAIAEKHGATHLRVFGSVARGDAQETSDVDFLVKWDYARVSAWGGVGLDIELSELLGCRVDVVSENGLSDHLKDEILSEAVPL